MGNGIERSKDFKKYSRQHGKRRNSSCCDRILLPESWRVQYSKSRSACVNEQQQELIDEFREDFLREDHKTYLLHGITGSGKTEVYLAAIEEVIKQGKQAIVLIPEIALTYQTVTRFTKRFGERVSILNSRLSKGERYDQWLRAQRGDVDVIIGPRSALFVPFSNLGLIVIDEEHEGSYKSEQSPNTMQEKLRQESTGGRCIGDLRFGDTIS